MATEPTETAIVVADGNKKGGVGKSTLTAIFALLLKMLNYRVVVIDSDPQQNLTSICGYPFYDGANLYDALLEQKTLQEVILPSYIRPESPFDFFQPKTEQEKQSAQLGPWLVPITSAANNADFDLKSKIPYWSEQLKEILVPLRTRVDYIFIDCPPSLGTLTLNALAAADYVNIPVVPERLVVEGLYSLFGVIAQTRKKANPSLKISGIMINKVQDWNAHRNVVAELQSQKTQADVRRIFGGDEKLTVFSQQIKQNAPFANAMDEQSLIVLQEPRSQYTKAYWYLLAELIAVIGGPAQDAVQKVVANLNMQK